MSTKELNKGLLGSLGAILRPSGFKGGGPGYRRLFPDVMHLISVQKSVYSTSESFKFTINIGVWSKDVFIRQGFGDQPPGSVARCHVDRRIRSFVPGAKDLWWEVRDEGDIISACAQIEPILLARVVPILDRAKTAESLLHEWKEGAPQLRPDSAYSRFIDYLQEAVQSKQE
jgi:hypothetical protein